jgi:Fe-S cluster assembly protein SufD
MAASNTAGVLAGVAASVAPGGPAWWREARAASRTAFESRGLPTPREERWRFLPLGSLEGPLWRAAPRDDAAMPESPAPLLADALQLRSIDGRLVGDLPAGDGLRIGRLADLPEVAEGRLGRLADRRAENPFLDLATSLADDVVVIAVAAGHAAARLEFHHQAVAGEAVCAPRLLVVLAESASLTLVERYSSMGAEARLVLPVFEAELAGGARLDHVRLQEEGPATRVFATSAVHLTGERAVYHGTAVQLGGQLLRHDLDARLTASHTEATLNGLVRVGDRAIVDNHTRIEHLAPHTSSHELYKVVLADKARSVFNGRIYVAQAAQKTDAYQANPNLLLSDTAVANSNPELEIYADDVRCTHGATYGDLDADALFYLRARGVPRVAAEAMLIEAFAGQVIDAVVDDDLRVSLRHSALSAALADVAE